jgi:hypothetical protein
MTKARIGLTAHKVKSVKKCKFIAILTFTAYTLTPQFLRLAKYE